MPQLRIIYYKYNEWHNARLYWLYKEKYPLRIGWPYCLYITCHFFFPLFYSYSVHGPRNKEVIMNLVQKEVEKCDRLSGFFTIMSMAGGTGSGLGAFVTQCLRDAFPTSFILNHVIWPYGTGEVNVIFLRDILQDYNCDHRGNEI